MEWSDIGGQPITWAGVVIFAIGTLRWLLTRGDDLKTEAIQELRRQRDEALTRARKAEKIVRAYASRYGHLPDAAISGSVSVADIMRHIRDHDDGPVGEET